MPIGAFKIGRLTIYPWQEATGLERIVSDILTEPVTRTLPPGWQGPYDDGRARLWINDRDSESEVLLITTQGEREDRILDAKEKGTPVGIMILSQLGEDGEIRIGYLLSERAWGKGLATEAVRGLVEACKANPDVHFISGGVDADNVASVRVLERNGFREIPIEDACDGAGGSGRFYRLEL